MTAGAKSDKAAALAATLRASDEVRTKLAGPPLGFYLLGFADCSDQAAALLRTQAARIAELEAEVADIDAVRERLADILRRTAIALRGPEPELASWSLHDLPERAGAAIAQERERWRAVLLDYFSVNDASWADTVAQANAAGITYVPLTANQAAALNKYNAMRELVGPNGHS